MLCEDTLSINASATKKNVFAFLRNQMGVSQAGGLVLGMSGGIDSSVVATLSAQALGPDKVLGLVMPSGTTDPQDMQDARDLGESLQIEQELVDIRSLEKAFTEVCPHFDSKDPISKGNLQPRFRMLVLYYYANKLDRLVVGSGNRSELLVGYFTKYGDGGVDMLPIGDLYKTQVRQLARSLDIPAPIIQKPPSAGFWPGQTDEGEMGIEYLTLDLILHGIVDLKMDRAEVAKALNIPEEMVKKVLQMIENSQHKRELPPIPKLRL